MTPAEALRHSVSKTYMEIGSHATGARARYEDAYWSCKSKIEHPIGNFAIRFQGSFLPMKPVEESLRNPLYRLYAVTGDTPSDLDCRLQSIGLRERYELTGLTLRPSGHAGDTELVGSESADDALEVARFIAGTFFWRSARTIREELAVIMAASHPNHEFYCLRDEFGIAAAGTLTLDVEVIGLYNLCVRPDVRSKGIGTSVFAELGRLAADRAPHVALMCGSDLVPWYSQRGCTVVGKLKAFSA